MFPAPSRPRIGTARSAAVQDANDESNKGPGYEQEA